MQVIQSMRFGDESDLFGKEKDDSFKGSIGNIYQSFSGIDVYESLEEIAESRPEEKEMMISVIMNCMQ